MTNYREYLKSVGIADTRIDGLYEAVNNLHRQIGFLDLHNMAKLREACPHIFDTVQQFADMNPGLNRYDPSFEEFLKECNKIVSSLIPFGIDDLPDANWRGYFEDGMSPKDAVLIANEDYWENGLNI